MEVKKDGRSLFRYRREEDGTYFLSIEDGKKDGRPILESEEAKRTADLYFIAKRRRDDDCMAYIFTLYLNY